MFGLFHIKLATFLRLVLLIMPIDASIARLLQINVAIVINKCFITVYCLDLRFFEAVISTKAMVCSYLNRANSLVRCGFSKDSISITLYCIKVTLSL
jgi:hypothetical protein